MRTALLWAIPTTPITQGRSQKWSPRDQLGRRQPASGQHTPLAPVTPFNVFLNTRGAQFTTLGIGLSQAPPAGGPEGGLEALFNNPTYGATFSTFSPSRLFTPVGSNLTEALFFVPGTNGASQQRSVASARFSQMLTSRMGSGLAGGARTLVGTAR